MTSPLRKVLLATMSATTLTAALVGTSVSAGHADALGLFDVGVNFSSAQATVQPGKDAYFTVNAFNSGSVAWLNARLSIDTGGKFDAGNTDNPAFAAGGLCSVSATPTDDTVVCNYAYLDGKSSEPPVSFAVRTPLTGSSMTSTATISATPATTPVTPDSTPSDDSPSITTTLQNNSGTGALTDGDSISFTSGDGAETTTFSVPQGGTRGGVVLVNLDEQNTTTNHITCAGSPCYGPAAEAKWQQIGGQPVQASNPFQTTVTYNLKQACNGLGGASGCLPIYVLRTGVTTGDAQQIPLCTTYAPNTRIPFASSDPCVYAIQKTNGIATYFLAELTDQIIPIGL